MRHSLLSCTKNRTIVFFGLLAVLLLLSACTTEGDSSATDGDDDAEGDAISVDGDAEPDTDQDAPDGDDTDGDTMPDGDSDLADGDFVDGDSDPDGDADLTDGDGDVTEDGDIDGTDGDTHVDGDADPPDGDSDPDFDPDPETESDAEECPEMWEGPAPPDCQQWDCALEPWPTCWVCDLVADATQNGQPCSYCEGECDCVDPPCVCQDGACIDDPSVDGDAEADPDLELEQDTELDVIDGDEEADLDPDPDPEPEFDEAEVEEESSPCADNNCHENATCQDLPGGGYECICNEGYFGPGTDCITAADAAPVITTNGGNDYVIFQADFTLEGTSSTYANTLQMKIDTEEWLEITYSPGSTDWSWSGFHELYEYHDYCFRLVDEIGRESSEDCIRVNCIGIMPDGDEEWDEEPDWEPEEEWPTDGDLDDEWNDGDVEEEWEAENDLDGIATPSFVPIPAGAFWMGSPDGCPGPEGYPGDCTAELGRYDNETLHFVELTYSFEMMTTEVTQGQWRTIAHEEGWGEDPSYFTECGEDCPVELVNWFEALEFANALSRNAGLSECYTLTNCTGTIGSGCGGSTGCVDDYKCSVELNGMTTPQDCEGYRLPTEAEWEYAVRAGDQYTAFYQSTGNNGVITQTDRSPLDPNIDQIGWYGGNSGVGYPGGYSCSEWYLGASTCGTHPVGSKEANAFGLYDMSGNLWEWNWDWYQSAYQSDVETDPTGPITGTFRVVRGSSWFDTARYCRSAYRSNWGSPDYRDNFFGFRLVRTLPDPTCEEDACNGHGDCDDTGERVSCTCQDNYTGYWCNRCAPGYFGYPDCITASEAVPVITTCNGGSCPETQFSWDPGQADITIEGTCSNLTDRMQVCDCWDDCDRTCENGIGWNVFDYTADSTSWSWSTTVGGYEPHWFYFRAINNDSGPSPSSDAIQVIWGP